MGAVADYATVEREMSEAIAAVLARHQSMPNRWVLVVEVMEESGERALETFASQDLRAWDALGMLGFALERERGGVHQGVGEDDD